MDFTLQWLYIYREAVKFYVPGELDLIENCTMTLIHQHCCAHPLCMHIICVRQHSKIVPFNSPYISEENRPGWCCCFFCPPSWLAFRYWHMSSLFHQYVTVQSPFLREKDAQPHKANMQNTTILLLDYRSKEECSSSSIICMTS